MEKVMDFDDIANKEEIDNKYVYWRKSIFLSIFVSWATFHFVRKCFAAIIPCLKTDLGLTITQIGFLSSIFYVAYSLSKVFSGYLSDSSNPRYFISIGLIFVGLSNIIFGMSSSITVMICCLTINSFFQAWAWPACTKLLTFWCSHNERGKWWGLCGAGQNLGAGLIPVFAAVIASHFSWRWAMYLSGAFSMLCGLAIIATVRDVPASLGLPTIEKYRNAPEYRGGEHKTISTSFISIMWHHVFTNIPLLVLSLSGLFLYVVRTAMNDWIPLYLMEVKLYSNLVMANGTIWWFEAGGLLGSIVACWSSDVIFKAQRLLASVFFSAILLFSVVFFYKVPIGNVFLDSLAMGMIGFLVFGVQAIFGLTASEMVIKSYAGTANSFAGSVCSVGAAISGLPLAMIMERYGWSGFFGSICFCCLLTLVFMAFAQFVVTRRSSRSLDVLVPSGVSEA